MVIGACAASSTAVGSVRRASWWAIVHQRSPGRKTDRFASEQVVGLRLRETDDGLLPRPRPRCERVRRACSIVGGSGGVAAGPSVWVLIPGSLVVGGRRRADHGRHVRADRDRACRTPSRTHQGVATYRSAACTRHGHPSPTAPSWTDSRGHPLAVLNDGGLAQVSVSDPGRSASRRPGARSPQGRFVPTGRPAGRPGGLAERHPGPAPPHVAARPPAAVPRQRERRHEPLDSGRLAVVPLGRVDPVRPDLVVPRRAACTRSAENRRPRVPGRPGGRRRPTPDGGASRGAPAIRPSSNGTSTATSSAASAARPSACRSPRSLASPGGDGFCRLLGTTDPFTPGQFAELYPSHDEYVGAPVTTAPDGRRTQAV